MWLSQLHVGDGGLAGIEWVKAREVAKDFTMHKIVLHKELSEQSKLSVKFRTFPLGTKEMSHTRFTDISLQTFTWLTLELGEPSGPTALHPHLQQSLALLCPYVT